MKNYKIQFTLFQSKATSGNTNLYFSFLIFHFSFKQLRCKSLPNPLQIPFRNGRFKGRCSKIILS